LLKITCGPTDDIRYIVVPDREEQAKTLELPLDGNTSEGGFSQSCCALKYCRTAKQTHISQISSICTMSSV